MLTPAVAAWLVWAVQLHAAIGFGLGVAFLVFGIERVTPPARGALAFRPLLLPGLMALWPLVAWRWWRAER